MELDSAVFIDSISCYWRWFGLFPFERIAGSYRFRFRFLAIGPLTTIASCITTFYYHFSEDYSNFPAAHYTIITFGFLFRELLPIYSCYLVYYKSLEVRRLFESLEDIARAMAICNYNFDMATPKWSYACHIAYVFFSLTYELSVNSSRYLLILSFYVGRLVWTFNVLQLVDLLNLFKTYFVSLNILANTECSLLQIRCLVEIYDRLCFLVSTFEQLFGFSLLLAFSHLFVFNVSFIYFNVARQLFPLVSGEIAVLTLVTLPVFIIQLVRPCSQAAESAKEFNIAMYSLMQEDSSDILSGDRKLRLHIRMQRKVEFSAFGLFTVDYSLIHSMLAAITTYFVFLLQFSSYPKNTV